MTDARVVRWLSTAAITNVVAVGVAAHFAQAATATNHAHDYDPTDSPAAACVVAASPAARPVQAPRWSEAESNYGYDDPGRLMEFRASPRSVEASPMRSGDVRDRSKVRP